MFEYALKNILKRPARSLLTLVGVGLMMTLMIAITGIVNSQKASMHAHASAGAGKLNLQPFLAGETYPASGIDMPQEQAEALLAEFGAEGWIQPRLSTPILYHSLMAPRYPNEPAELLIAALQPGQEETFTGSIANDITAQRGVESFANPAAIGVSHPAILGSYAAEVISPDTPLQVGDTFNQLGQTFTLIGVLQPSQDIVVNHAILLPLEEAQTLLGKEGFVSSLILTQARAGDDVLIRERVEAEYPLLVLVDESTTRANIEAGLKVFEQMVNMIAIVVVVSAGLLMLTVTLITVRERTREIGVLRAIGAGTGMVVCSLFWELLILSTAGALLGGVCSGLVLAFALEENLFDLMHILTKLPLALVLTLFAGLVPAWNISRILPAESLRYE